MRGWMGWGGELDAEGGLMGWVIGAVLLVCVCVCARARVCIHRVRVCLHLILFYSFFLLISLTVCFTQFSKTPKP